MKDEFDAFLECGRSAHGFQRMRCGDCGHDKRVAFSCKRRGTFPSCGAWRMARTTAHLVDHVIPDVPVRQWVHSLPIPLRLLLAAQPKPVTAVLQVGHRVITPVPAQAGGREGRRGRKWRGHADPALRVALQAAPGQWPGPSPGTNSPPACLRPGSAVNLNIHLHCLVLDGVYRRGADGVPIFGQTGAPTDDELRSSVCAASAAGCPTAHWAADGHSFEGVAAVCG